MKKTATRLPFPSPKYQFRGDARLYKLSEPVKYSTTLYDGEPPRDPLHAMMLMASGAKMEKVEREADHVIVSAVTLTFTGPETYIFPCTADGVVLDWAELEGSFRGGINHAKALNGAGYQCLDELTEGAKPAPDAEN